MGLRLRKTGTVPTVLAIGLLALFGLGLGAVAYWHASASHPSAPGAVGPSHLSLAAPRAESHPSVNSARISFDTPTLPAFSIVPFVINLTVTTFNATVNANTTNVSLQMVADIGATEPYGVASFASWAIPVTSSGQSHFTTTVDQANVFAHEASWVSPNPSWPENGRYYFVAYVTVVVNATITVSGSAVTLGHGTQLVAVQPWAQLVSPDPVQGPISPGNATVAASYGGDWISDANVSIYSNPSHGLVYAGSLVTLWIGNVTVLAPAQWLVVSPGVYNVTITLVTAYGWTGWFNSSITVIKSATTSQTVYVNTTSWNNATGTTTQLFNGWSPQQASATLLVLGLIIGMVVALVLGRMMWGSAPAAPAQPWSGSKGANECPICHQSFASEQEMKDHQKTAHGM